MRFIIDLTSKKVVTIQSLINGGKYDTVQQFILTAIENQLYLESQSEETIKMPILSRKPRELPLVSLPSSQVKSVSVSRLLPTYDVVTVPEPPLEAISTEILWALHNRIFPVKVVLRVLINLLNSDIRNRNYVDLAIFQERAVEEARRIGQLLLKADKSYGRKHGEKMSTALPISRRDRTINRFKYQFVGTLTSKDRLEGAPAILRFVNMKRDSEGRTGIGITNSGLKFALLESPVLDKSDYTRALSDDECRFYIQHISDKLPKEYSLSLSVLEAISSGKKTPDELTQVVISSDINVSDNEAQSIRSSLVSRLLELGLLKRRRIGLNVTYAVTTKGQNLINKGGIAISESK